MPHLPGYESFRDRLAWADLGSRTTVLATGIDAAKFLDNFATAALAPLAAGAGSETFFLDGRGWVIALATALRVDEGLVLEAAAGLGPRLRDHLEHYHIRERVELVDDSPAWASLLVGGPAAQAWLASSGAIAPDPLFAHHERSLGGIGVRLVRDDHWCDPGWLVRCRAGDHGRLLDFLRGHDLPEADAATLETLRIERGTPGPADIRDKTLPQELRRDARAISFTKGCYLGQETVARLDALGHVNRRLVRLAVAGDPPRNAEVHGDGELVGQITSDCFSPRLGCRLGLGILSTKIATATSISVSGVEARIVEGFP
jgi:folate-binding protein YgfZ